MVTGVLKVRSAMWCFKWSPPAFETPHMCEDLWLGNQNTSDKDQSMESIVPDEMYISILLCPLQTTHSTLKASDSFELSK